ncbi:MAG: hypothetical protein AAF480_14075 [Actinomycetota bacterium]
MTDAVPPSQESPTTGSSGRDLADLLRRPRITWSLHLDDEGRSSAAFTSSLSETGDRREAQSRLPVRLVDGELSAAGRSVTCRSEHPDDVCEAFLELVRTLRGNTSEDITGFRRGDIEELAEALDIDAREVLDRLARLLGTSMKRRDAMTAAFVAGTSVIPCRDEPVSHGPSLLAQRLSQDV